MSTPTEHDIVINWSTIIQNSLPSLLASEQDSSLLRRTGPSKEMPMAPSGAVNKIASTAIVNTCVHYYVIVIDWNQGIMAVK